jgi:hypothetical protein
MKDEEMGKKAFSFVVFGLKVGREFACNNFMSIVEFRECINKNPHDRSVTQFLTIDFVPFVVEVSHGYVGLKAFDFVDGIGMSRKHAD